MKINLVKTLELFEDITKKTLFTFITCSVETKKIIDTYTLPINYIVDRNMTLNNNSYSGIKIISYEELYNMDNPTIVIASNHVLDILNDIKSKDFNCMIYILYEHINLYKNNICVSTQFKNSISIDSPLFYDQIKEQSQQIFIKKVCKLLVEKNIPLILYPDSELNMFSKVKNNNSILLSYHTRGKSKDNIYRYKNSYLADYVVIDKKGYSGWHSLANKDISYLLNNISELQADNFFLKLFKDNVEKNKSFYTQDNKKFNFPKNYIFFPLQVYSDSVMELSYFNPLALINFIANSLKKHNIDLVIKPHPFCKDVELISLIEKLKKEKKVIIFEGSIHEAIKNSNMVFVINSGVGFESLLHLKPVVSFGKVEYSYVTKSIKNISQLKIFFNNPVFELTALEKLKIKKFLYYYTNYKLININHDNEIEDFIKKCLLNKYLTNLFNNSWKNYTYLPFIERHKWVKNKKNIVIIGVPGGYKRFISPFFKKFNIIFIYSYNDINIENIILDKNIKKIFIWETYKYLSPKLFKELKKKFKLKIIHPGLIRSFGIEYRDNLPLSIIKFQSLNTTYLQNKLKKLTFKEEVIGKRIIQSIVKNKITKFNMNEYNNIKISKNSILYIPDNTIDVETALKQITDLKSKNNDKNIYFYHYFENNKIEDTKLLSICNVIPKNTNFSMILSQNIDFFYTNNVFIELEILIYNKSSINFCETILKKLISTNYTLEKIVYLFYIKFSKYRLGNYKKTIKKIKLQQDVNNFKNNIKRF